MRRTLVGCLVLFVAACTEQSTAPGVCPNFCPAGSIVLKDTVFTDIIHRDSSFSGYEGAQHATIMLAADLPGVVDSRPIFLLTPMQTRVAPKSGDTTTIPIFVDSARLRLQIAKRDTAATNLRVKLYHLPLTIDSTTDFASIDTSFGTPFDSIDVSDLLTRPAVGDTRTVRIWGDTIRTDSMGHVLQISKTDSSLILFTTLDTTKAPFSVPDSGKLAFGVRVAADSFATVQVAANESGTSGPLMRWFFHYIIHDSTGVKPDSTVHSDASRAPRFDSFVFSPPNPPLDSNLAVGGAPAVRSLLRVDLPKFLHDSIDVVRATLLLEPVAALQGSPHDSTSLLARPVTADLGAKSPLSTLTTIFGHVVMHVATSDTVKIELTDMVRAWAADTTLPTAFFIGQSPEASTYLQPRFYSSRTPALAPALHVTYVKRFPFGQQ